MAQSFGGASVCLRVTERGGCDRKGKVELLWVGAAACGRRKRFHLWVWVWVCVVA